MQTEIRYVKGMPNKLLFGSIALISVCVLNLLVGVVMALHTGLNYRAFVLIAVGIVGIIFFGYSFILGRRRCSGGLALLATEDGLLLDQTKPLFVKVGMIGWEEIKQITIFGLGKQNFLGIEMLDDNRLRAGASVLEKILFKIDDRLGYPQIQISQNAVDGDLDRLTGLLEEYRSSTAVTKG
jgi:hypothetical protein